MLVETMSPKATVPNTTTATEQIRKAAFIGNRPNNAPAEWTIFYASRPIRGDVTWQDRGFFAAIDPNGEEAAKMAKYNAEMDAVEISYFGEEEAYNLGKEAYRNRFANNPKILAKVDDPEYRPHIIAAFLRNFGAAK